LFKTVKIAFIANSRCELADVSERSFYALADTSVNAARCIFRLKTGGVIFLLRRAGRDSQHWH